MALRFVESFDTYGGSSTVPPEMETKWGTVSHPFSCKPNVTGRKYGYGCEIGLAYSEGLYDELTTQTYSSANTWIIGFGFYRATPVGYENVGEFLFLRSGTTQRCRLVRQATSWELRNGSGSTVYTWNGVSDIHDVWEFVDLKVTVNGSSSSAELRIDGVSLGSSGTITLSGTGADNVRWSCLNGNGTDGRHYLLDDVYLCDSSGTTNNDFLGPSVAEVIVPSGAGASTTWNPSSGSNYAAVDEKPSDDDTSYVESSQPGDRDSYAYGDLTVLDGAIHGLQVNAVAKAGSGGLFNISHRHSGSYSDSSTITPASTYTNYSSVREHSTGSTAWTVSSVNAAEFGLMANE